MVIYICKYVYVCIYYIIIVNLVEVSLLMVVDWIAWLLASRMMYVYVVAELELHIFVIKSRDMIGDTYIVTYVSVYAYMCELLRVIGRTDG